MTVNLETLRSLLLGNSVRVHPTEPAGLPEHGPLEEKEKAEDPLSKEVVLSPCAGKVAVNKQESEDLERSSRDLYNIPENGCDPVGQVRPPEAHSSAHQDGAWMSLDISEYELQMLEMQAKQEELEEQSTLQFQVSTSLHRFKVF